LGYIFLEYGFLAIVFAYLCIPFDKTPFAGVLLAVLKAGPKVVL
jgi:hypothetical protein